MRSRDLLKKYFAAGCERVPCNLCGADDTEVLLRYEFYDTPSETVICRRCGLMYLNPRWTEQSYQKFYEADYRTLAGEEDDIPFEMMLRQRVHGAEIHQFCAPYIRGKRVLDIGCAAGGVLSAFALAGDYKVCGVEPSQRHVEFVRSQLGYEVHEGLFGEMPLPRESFDLVILTQTLNHMLDPRGAMAAIRDLLTPGGMFFVEVQNFPEHAKRARIPVQVDHTYYFCAETLECMARRLGLEPVRTEVDTAAKMNQLHRYMRHRSASLHVRMLLRKTAPDASAPLPNYRSIRRQVRKALLHKGGMTLRTMRHKTRMWFKNAA